MHVNQRLRPRRLRGGGGGTLGRGEGEANKGGGGLKGAARAGHKHLRRRGGQRAQLWRSDGAQEGAVTHAGARRLRCSTAAGHPFLACAGLVQHDQGLLAVVRAVLGDCAGVGARRGVGGGGSMHVRLPLVQPGLHSAAAHSAPAAVCCTALECRRQRAACPSPAVVGAVPRLRFTSMLGPPAPPPPPPPPRCFTRARPLLGQTNRNTQNSTLLSTHPSPGRTLQRRRCDRARLPCCSTRAEEQQLLPPNTGSKQLTRAQEEFCDGAALVLGHHDRGGAQRLGALADGLADGVVVGQEVHNLPAATQQSKATRAGISLT